MTKLSFATFILSKLLSGQPRNCPHCSSNKTIILQRKKLLLELRRCQECLLMYRYPKDNVEDNVDFYQLAYQEGTTTEMPLDAELSNLLASNFSNHKDLSTNISIVKEQNSQGSLLDYGCSWGYGVYQFVKAGYQAIGFEISHTRAEYGRQHLAVDIIDSFAALEKLPPHSFDIIHTSHVLEHLPELNQAFSTFQKLLKPTGCLIIFVPNASGKSACELGVNWGPMIGEKHNLAIDAKFLAHNLPKYGFEPVFNSSPYQSKPITYESEEQARRELQGDELLAIARPITN